jgi:hypothetical protein
MRGHETSPLRADHHQPAPTVTKAVLFLLLGVVAAAILIAEAPHLSALLLLAVTVWALARAYYCAFYVIEHYIDGSYKFAGIWSAVVFLARRVNR